MAQIVFFCHHKPSEIETFEYYKQDLDTLRALGHQVTVCGTYWEIPTHFDAMFVWWWTRAFVPVIMCRALGRPCIVTGVYNFRLPSNHGGVDYFRRPVWQRFLLRAATKWSTLNLFINDQELTSCTEYFKL